MRTEEVRSRSAALCWAPPVRCRRTPGSLLPRIQFGLPLAPASQGILAVRNLEVDCKSEDNLSGGGVPGLGSTKLDGWGHILPARVLSGLPLIPRLLIGQFCGRLLQESAGLAVGCRLRLSKRGAMTRAICQSQRASRSLPSPASARPIRIKAEAAVALERYQSEVDSGEPGSRTPRRSGPPPRRHWRRPRKPKRPAGPTSTEWAPP
jgi:hypothetical protein